MTYSGLPQESPPEMGQIADLPAKSKSKLPLLVSAALLMVAGVWLGAQSFLTPSRATSVAVSGRIEGYTTDIGAKIPGRVKAVMVREGDRVHKGQVIAELDDDELQAQLQGATARLMAAKQQEQQAALQITIIESQIQEAQLDLQQSQGDAQGQIVQAASTSAAMEAQLNQAKAQLTQSEAELKLAQLDRDRYQSLRQEGAVTQQQFDKMQTAFDVAQATVQSRRSAVEAAQRQLNAAEGQFVQAQTSALNPPIRTTRVNVVQKQLLVAQSQLAAAQAEVANAAAARKQVEAQLAYLKVVSPIDGVVVSRSVEPGAVVGSGKTLLTLINPDTVYLRGFIPESEIGNVKVGQSAEVRLDSAPHQPLTAKVSAIDTQAAFTPENIYFTQDRVKQTFGVKLSIQQPGGYAKPGMPADAEILLDAKATP